jgi:serine/threonine-protein kinase
LAERQFGPYRLVQLIATGGMAEIHLARARGVAGFEKFVALKLIHPNFGADEQFIQMLIDEAKITVQLQHANIAHIFDLGRVGGITYITMEYVDGRDLYQVLREAAEKELPIPCEIAAHVAREVCAGLDYAHKKCDRAGRPLGIVHRDVSPQNVLLSHVGEVKIVDFGIAKATMRAQKTAVGVIKGKYYYMSPEQAWGDPVDHRADVFSTGILLYEMLTGRMLYLEEDMQRLRDLVRKADIVPPSRHRREVPTELDRIVMRALAPNVGQRYQSAEDFRLALETFLFTFAPDFSPSRLASFMSQVFVDAAGPPIAPSIAPPVRPPPSPATAHRVTHGMKPGEIMTREDFTDENSIIFRMPEPDTTARGKLRPLFHSRPAHEETPHLSFAETDLTEISAPPSFDGDPGDDLFGERRETTTLRRLDRKAPPPSPLHDDVLTSAPPPIPAAIVAAAAADLPRPVPPPRQRPPSSLPLVGPTPRHIPAPATIPHAPGETTPAFTQRIDRQLPGPRRWPWVALGAVILVAAASPWVFRARQASVPTASLEVISIPPGATVTVNGRLLPGVTPLAVSGAKPEREMHLRVELAKHELWERQEVLPRGQHLSVVAALKPIFGTLHVESVPAGAEVFLQNRSLGRTPLWVRDLDPFLDAPIEVRLPGYKPSRKPLRWSGQRRASLHFQLEATKW